MRPLRLVESDPITVSLTEWEKIGPADDARLIGTSLDDDVPAQRQADSLRSVVDVREGYRGLEVATTSYVGHIDLGRLRITIRPKLRATPLATLLRYAYGLRDLKLLPETHAPAVRHGLHDVLIEMLAAEAEELLHRGLARRYEQRSGRLASPRGQILVRELSGRGGITEARLPCRHFERSADWPLNRLVCAGLELAGAMSADRDLRRRVHRLARAFAEPGQTPTPNLDEIDRTARGLTRLTAAYAPALTVIRLLREMLGSSLDEPDTVRHRTSGFLFDMNRFFQRLLSRFLHDHLVDGRIEDEQGIGNLFAYARDANPRRRHAPEPRPDYALFDRNGLRAFLDAKYRDVWERGVPAEWLYQLAAYALASPDRVSVLLYASMSGDARDERLDIRAPIPWPNGTPASIILRPVPLTIVAELLQPEVASRASAERRRLAQDLVLLGARPSRPSVRTVPARA